MTADNSPSSATSSSSRSSSPPPHIPPSPLSEVSPFPPADSPSSPVKQNSLVESSHPDTFSYSPHAVGLGIRSPQPLIGPFGQAPRASLSSLHHRSSVTLQRSNSAGSSVSERPIEMPTRATPPSEELNLPLPSHSLSYISPQPSGDITPPIADMSSASSGPPSASSLRIAIPPPNASASTSTPSPPLLQPTAGIQLSPAGASAATDSNAPSSESQQLQSVSSGAFFNPNDTTFVLGSDLSMPTADLNVDFTEFDADGLSALEKIYLFSRSRAGFHRVFIVHALPKYLGADDAAGERYANPEETEYVSPAEAVEYVLPLLNGLALDEDEAVKEALAAELLPIIWWFITHCRLVEDDFGEEAVTPPYTTEDAGVTLISVQAFTPIMGTLLLSQNTLVGAPARQAVVHLLKRIWRADEREDGRGPPPPSDDEPPDHDRDVGLLGRSERRLFEREIVHQVVIGMGRLDMPDTDDGLISNMSTPRSAGGHHEHHSEHHLEHHLSASQDLHPVAPPVPASAPDSSTAGSTPLAPPAGSAPDSYFPMVTAPHGTPTASPLISPSTQGVPSSDNDVRSPLQGVVSPPAFRFTQPPPSPLRTHQPTNVSSSSMSVSSPARSMQSSTHGTSSPARLSQSPADFSASPAQTVSPPATSPFSPVQTHAQTTVSITEVTRSPGAPAPTPSSSTSSISSTPSLTTSASTSTSSSSTSLNSPAQFHTPGSATPNAERFVSILSSPREEDEMNIDEDMNMALEMQGDVAMADESKSERSSTQTQDLHLDLSGGDTEANPSGRGLGISVADVQETQNARMSTWLSSGLPETDVNMQDVSGMAQGGDGAEMEEEDNSDDAAEAAVGRLSSMSLMAAVTASGTLKDDTKTAFVAEVERVGRDPVYWVRREAAFAVGALAKVVPDELVNSSLLPLFESLCRDPTWHVRHSVLFALPAILARLPPSRKRPLALDVMLPLSSDESPTVRSAVLEALGEVMYTFIDVEGGPPQELLDMFLGVRDETTRTSPTHRNAPFIRSQGSRPVSESSFSDASGPELNTDLDIYDDPSRPLVCAFNFPAVALTLGRDRWQELRNLYRTLAQSPTFKVRRTLAASLGEMAKIIGPEHAREDLMDVWRASIGAEDTDVRLKAAECAAVFARALELPERAYVLEDLGREFSTGKLKGWREREEVMKSLATFLDIHGVDDDVLRRLLMQGLGDRVSAIREAAVSVTPAFVRAWRSTPHLINALREDIRALAHSDSYRERTTFVTCEQAILFSENSDFVLFDENFWEILAFLTRDLIVDVRIRVARLLGTISDDHAGDVSIMARLLALTERLEQDSSQDVRAFALSIRSRSTSPPRPSALRPDMTNSAVTFSRPPPPPPGPS